MKRKIPPKLPGIYSHLQNINFPNIPNLQYIQEAFARLSQDPAFVRPAGRRFALYLACPTSSLGKVKNEIKPELERQTGAHLVFPFDFDYEDGSPRPNIVNWDVGLAAVACDGVAIYRPIASDGAIVERGAAWLAGRASFIFCPDVRLAKYEFVHSTVTTVDTTLEGWAKTISSAASLFEVIRRDSRGNPKDGRLSPEAYGTWKENIIGFRDSLKKRKDISRSEMNKLAERYAKRNYITIRLK